MAEMRKSFWLISISAACWKVWLARNGLVFERRRVYMEFLIFQLKMRALLWIRAVYDEVRLQENFWWIFPQRCRVDSFKSNPAVSFWRPSTWLGVARALFFGSIATYDAEVAEIGAVKVALEVFLAMKWKIDDSLFIELGSLVVFSWRANKVMRLWSLQAIFAGIENDMSKVGTIVFSLAEKKSNEMAFSLVIAGCNRVKMYKAWW
ncbi:hypothetical protein ERO13_A05G266350v2 [Gossypium hirsutum]|nr:hypothetical protein ERO13_A05G266350v2 [Gossypium hirsutum]